MGISHPPTVYNKYPESAISSKEADASLGWEANPSVRNLLDVISSILVNEYIETARRNPEPFKGDT